MIESISIKDFTDENWRLLHEFTQEINRKFNPENLKPELTWSKYKGDILKHIEIYKSTMYEEHIILENGSPVAWVDIALDSRSSAFGFDSIYEDFPDYILKIIFEKLFEFIKSHNLDTSFHWTFNDRRIKALKRIGVPIYDEMIQTRFQRENMDASMYDRIIGNYSDLSGYKICFYNNFPEKLLDDYVEFMNDIFRDIHSLNPFPVQDTVLSRAQQLERLSPKENSGSIMNMYLILDSYNKIAACCSLYIDTYNPKKVRHEGGITAVRKDQRGKGFGRYLKALNYKKLLEENKDFEFVTTDTMPWNKYMYRINEEFGFKPVKYGYDFKLTKEFLENFIK